MFLEEFLWASQRLNYQIIGTDISTQVLEKAILAIYSTDKIEPVPESFRKKYLLKSRDRSDPQVRIIPELRSKIKFQRLNFMDEKFAIADRQDIIFCRNVIIYFDRQTQERFLAKLCDCLQSGGYLFMGHSETLSGMPLPLKQLAPAVYIRT